MLRATALFAICLSLSGCADVECVRNTDCGDHTRCELNRCISDCAADRDCPSGETCDPNGVCVSRPDAKSVDVTADLADTPDTPDVQPADVSVDARDDLASDAPHDVSDADVASIDADVSVADVAPIDADVITVDAADASRDVAPVDASDASVDAFDGSNVPPDAVVDAVVDVAVDDGAAIDVALDSPADARDVVDASDASGCVRTFACEAITADAECGVVTATGRRYPDLGRPYCSDRLTRAGCNCDLLRCVSPGPLCAGTYVATFNERLVSGCNGIAGELSGTCTALWNVVQTWPAATTVSDRTLYNVSLTWSFADYTQMFTLTTPTQVRLVVEQSTWFSDVSGVGNSGRSEVARVSVAPAP